MRIAVISKVTSLEHYRRKYGGSGKTLKKNLERAGIDANELLRAEKAHAEALKFILSTLSKENCKIVEYLTDNAPTIIKNVDLVIAIGGDGTLLSASHRIIDETPFLGINSDPTRSRGFLSSCVPKFFPQKLKRILSGTHPLIPFTRLQLTIPDEKRRIPFVLNDIFLGGNNPEDTVKYQVTINKKTVRHMDSGFLISTGAGSTAWIYNASRISLSEVSSLFRLAKSKKSSSELKKLVNEYNSALLLDKSASVFKYYSRDSITGPLASSDFQSGYATELHLRSNMYHGRIVVDNRFSYDFSNGKQAKVTISSASLMVYD